MKEIEEQISEYIWQIATDTPISNMTDQDKDHFTRYSGLILSEVTIEVVCPDFHTGTIKIIKDEHGNGVCEKCKGTSKITITLKEAIERLQSE